MINSSSPSAGQNTKVIKGMSKDVMRKSVRNKALATGLAVYRGKVWRKIWMTLMDLFPDGARIVPT